MISKKKKEKTHKVLKSDNSRLNISKRDQTTSGIDKHLGLS